ncbi:adenosine deaminase/editase [Circinella umbellata]|nr:adenosine deaminase/editase [Circinella umbellata]
MTWQEIEDLSNQLATKSIECFNRLPKAGKPTQHGSKKSEWTVLACILQVYAKSKDDYSVQVVSLGTGLKCLPYSKLCKQGQLVHDSHAEVIAKRGFQRYILDQIEKSLKGNDGPFCVTSKTDNDNVSPHVTLKSGYSFHMYISQSPCGDASMTGIAESQTAESLAAFQAGSKRKSNTFDLTPLTNNIYANKKRKIISNNSIQQQQKQQDECNESFKRGRYGFDNLGILRTKPGRLDSEPTLCMSCSDKLARWNVLGVQSAILTQILENPIYLESIVVGDLFDQVSLERALYGRLEKSLEKDTLKLSPAPYRLHRPKIFKTSESFEFSKTILESKYSTVIPSGTAILWIEGFQKSEVIVYGRKQGAPKGKPTNSKTRSSICKLALFQKFLECYSALRESLSVPMDQNDDKMTYNEWKQKAKVYQETKTCLLDECFSQWVQTPKEFEEFTIKDA